MSVAGDEDGAFVLGECKQVVVTRVGRPVGTCARIRRNDCCEAKQGDELGCVVFRNPTAELRVGEGALELVQQSIRDEELERAAQPAVDELCGRAAGGEQSGNEDVGVEDSAHSAPARPRLVLRLDRERERLVLANLVSLPKAGEQVETELATECFLDYLAVALAGAGAPDFHRPKYFLVDRERRPHFRHISAAE